MNWDTQLNIDTEGLDERLADWHHFRYEPTPYEVLERLLDSGLINEKNHVLDMGCGKGRVSFFLAQTIGCRTTGVDFDSNMIEIAETIIAAESSKPYIAYVSKVSAQTTQPEMRDAILAIIVSIKALEFLFLKS